MDIRLRIVCFNMLLTICFVDGAPGPLECSTACEKKGPWHNQAVGKLDLNCPKNETIYIISAVYGRLDKATCPTPHVFSTHCFANTAQEKVKALCEGKETCSVKATNEVFGDPCIRTEKYLSICYMCTGPPVNLTALEAKVTTMMEMITNLNATIAGKCDAKKCTAMENCFADKSSCPAAAAGKVSITGAITALETPPIFNCILRNTLTASITGIKVAPYFCDVNQGNVVNAAAGDFTADKPGKYRLTFMAVTVNQRNRGVTRVSCIMKKSTLKTITEIARSVATTNGRRGAKEITTTIDIIHELKEEETVHVEIEGRGVGIVGAMETQVTFTGEFIRS